MIRQTRQRLAIEAFLRAEDRPLSPHEIHRGAQRLVPSMGLRTVYRQLKDMSAEGLVVGVDYPGQPLRYERTGAGHRAHFICHGCAKVYAWEAEVPDVEVRAPVGYMMTGQETVFYGYCPTCVASSRLAAADGGA
ncbi:MAG: hypothetical protein RL648_163 [Verrucomicrobiota bacterium]|jgi:Fur family ferric uptake transcriptional regulator